MRNLFRRLFTSKQPKIGQRLRLTWLAFNNGYPEPNAYIGMEGIVDYLYADGGFCINTGNSILCITSKLFKYKKL